MTAEATEALKSPAGGTAEAAPSVSQAAESLKHMFMFWTYKSFLGSKSQSKDFLNESQGQDIVLFHPVRM